FSTYGIISLVCILNERKEKMNNMETLRISIEKLKIELNHLIERKEFVLDEEVLTLSQKIDRLLIDYMRLT
ncbi:Spo0E family sporulation regulatory protein-aspartic acid phosphatase, partial [Anaerosolibacter sp.]|uniref:Spo0E family sporulation regulatory protein-aspartic acid phosphatase n=1 Tax=Anaerosolibacter sp. TaxID=1872527 RepID=UPI0039EED79A